MKIFNHKTKVLVLSAFTIFALSAVLLTVETVSSGAEIANLEKTAKNLASQKRELEESFVKTISMGDLQEKSTEMGFVKAENLMYLSGREPVAKLP